MAITMASTSAFDCCQRSGGRLICFFPLRFPIPVSVTRRGDHCAFPPDSSTAAATRSRATGRCVKWKRRATLAPLAAGPDEGKHRHARHGSVTKAAASTSGATPPGEGSRQPLPPEAVTFSASISTDLPLHDSPEVDEQLSLSLFLSLSSDGLFHLFQASFDEYLDDRSRIFGAIFPDRRRCRRLNDEEWRVEMLPIQFLFASVNPVVVMRLRCKSQGRGYRPMVPPHVSRVLELRVVRWELQGLEGSFVPSHFVLDVQGLLYPDRTGEARARRSRLKGHLQMSISLVLPPVLTLVPEHVVKGVAESVLKRLVERMKQEVDGSLLTDFQSFRGERKKKQLISKGFDQQPPVHGGF